MISKSRITDQFKNVLSEYRQQYQDLHATETEQEKIIFAVSQIKKSIIKAHDLELISYCQYKSLLRTIKGEWGSLCQ